MILDAVIKKFEKASAELFRRYDIQRIYYAEGDMWVVSVYSWRSWCIIYWWHVRDGNCIYLSDQPDCLIGMDFEKDPDLDSRWKVIWHYTQPERLKPKTIEVSLKLILDTPTTEAGSAKYLVAHIEKFIKKMMS